MNFLEKISRLPERKRRGAAIGITLLFATLFTLIGIYGVGQYGLTMFILTPFFVGLSTPVIYGYHHQISRAKAIRVSIETIALLALGLLIFAIEGIICMIMAAPIALVLVLFGAILGHLIVSKKQDIASASILILAASIPASGFIEKASENFFETTSSVVTTVKINADPQTVWKNVISFPELDHPQELLFKSGISYPINATIKGEGVGAIRYCNFTTGSFVEPITKWEETTLLAFDVLESPVPMKELSFWDVDAPHLHDYFISKKGQFKLTRISENETLLEGTTWYHNRIKPNFYWNLWSDYIIHQIHNRVLQHIKLNSEKNNV